MIKAAIAIAATALVGGTVVYFNIRANVNITADKPIPVEVMNAPLAVTETSGYKADMATAEAEAKRVRQMSPALQAILEGGSHRLEYWK